MAAFASRVTALRHSRAVLLVAGLVALAGCGGAGDRSTAGEPRHEPLIALGELKGDGVLPFVDFALSGRTLLVAAGPAGLQLVDLKDPATPRQIGVISSGFVPDHVGAVAAEGTTAAVAMSPGCFSFCNIGLPAPGEIGVFDLTDPAEPRQVATIAQPARALLLENQLLYALDEGFITSATLRVYDLSKPSAPRLLGSTETARAARITKHGSTLFLGFSSFLSNVDGVQSIDVTDPSRPTVQITAGVPPFDPGINHPAASSQVLFTASGTPEVRAYDLQRLAAPPLRIAMPRPAADVAVSGSRLFVAQNGAGVAVYSLSGATVPPRSERPIDVAGDCVSVRTFAGVGLVHITDGEFCPRIGAQRLVFFTLPE